jgi:hypothetical protein
MPVRVPSALACATSNVKTINTKREYCVAGPSATASVREAESPEAVDHGVGKYQDEEGAHRHQLEAVVYGCAFHWLPAIRKERITSSLETSR